MRMNALRLGVVLLAAGRSERFGSNKLLADFGGRPVICRALEAVQSVSPQKALVVTGSADIAALAHGYGFGVINNTDAHLGQSHSVCLGIAAMQDMDAALLLVGDQPKLTGESLSLLWDTFCASGKGIACLRDESHMGNPAVFSKAYFSQLLALSGDRGAKAILNGHPDDLIVAACVHEGELADADTPQALEEMRQNTCK